MGQLEIFFMRYFFLYWDNSKSSLFNTNSYWQKDNLLTAVSVYSLKFLRQRKLKYKKKLDKSFLWNIHEFAVSRPQKVEKYEPFLITSIRDINRNSYWSRFWWNLVLLQKHSSGDVLTKTKKICKIQRS